MASSYSTDLKLEIMVTGEQAGLWGDITNTNLVLLQQAIAGFESISIAGGAQTTTLVMSNAAISNARNAVIKLTGVITGNQVVTIPNSIEKNYIIENGTSGAFTVQFKTASGTGPTFSTTDKGIKFLYSNGTDVIDVNANLSASSFEQINLPTQNELRFEDSTGGQYVALKAGATIASNLTFTLPTADGSSGQALTTNGSGTLSFATIASITWQAVQTGNFTAAAGEGYFVNTTSGAITVTLPSGTPAAGAQIQLVDYAGTFDTNALTINPNGNKIEGATANLALTGEREGVTLTFIDATQGWLATSGINEGTDALSTPPYSIDFLVVAGAGGGGGYYAGGGGGAGGYRTSTQTVNAGTTITVTVGDGGTAGGTAESTLATSGSASSISGSGLTTISSAGGGGAGNAGGNSPRGAGLDGGSGGGAGNSNSNPGSGGTGNTPSTSPSQGNNGGNAQTNPPYRGGGGGGASSAGVVGTSTGNGGSGTASSITGSSVTRAGGGGAGCNSTGTAGTGGAGGGGNGSSTSAGTNGTANTGGGGGGSGGISNLGGSGGKGVVILSMLDANYSGTTTGSPTVAQNVSGNTVLTFNGSGSYTA